MAQAHQQSTFVPRRQPFLYVLAAVTIGILADRWIETGRWTVVTLALASFAASISFVLTKKDRAATVALLVAFVASGSLLSVTERSGATEKSLTRLYKSGVIIPDDPVELTGVLTAVPEPAPDAYYLDVEAQSIRNHAESFAATGRARLIIQPDDSEAHREFDQLALDYGSRVRFLVRLERAREFSNPGSPDFNDFLERHGYDLKGVIKSPLLIEHIGDAPRIETLAILYHVRLRLMRAIDSRFKSPVAGTLKAMLAGNRYFLDGETVERLRASSTFHTLVIAGLHIGIIAWALLGGSGGIRRRRPMRVVVCLAVLWAYAVMVGLAPPVTRATTMITAGLLGPLIFRQAASINTVALAAVIMLALKPALVADPGFQLSFIAVAGIVALALPFAEKLRQTGQWRPASHTPHPPSCSRAFRYVAESLFWNERAFNEEMRRSPIRYRLKKAGAARLLGRLRVQPILRGAALLVITSASIQLSTLPLMALYFNRVAPVGILLNVAAGLLTGVIMLTALGAIAVGGLSAWVAAQLELVVNAAHYLLVNAIVPFIDVPLATFRVAHYEGWHSVIYVLYFAPLAMLAVLIDRWRPVSPRLPFAPSPLQPASSSPRLRFSPSLFCALALASAVIAVIRPPTNQANGRLTIHFLDVGQGDSAFVVFPHGKTMLIDGGGEIHFDRKGQAQAGAGAAQEQDDEREHEFSDSSFSIGEAVVSRFIWSLGRTRVDYVLATHADADHIGGLCDVVRNLSAGEAIVGHVPIDDPEYDRFAHAVKGRGVPLYAVSEGERFDIDGVTIEVLWPPASGSLVTSGNNDSVVWRLVYGSISILLTGDIEQGAEDSLVRSGVDLHADLLKVPHHGSKTSSTEAFIDAVNPKYAVISVGERSRFGHPYPAVVNRYAARGVTLFQTGRDGMVTVDTDGSGLEINTYRK